MKGIYAGDRIKKFNARYGVEEESAESESERENTSEDESKEELE